MTDIHEALMKFVSHWDADSRGNSITVYPDSPQDALDVIKFANSRGMPVLPCGNLTRITTHTHEEMTVLLSSGSMDSLIELSEEDSFITVGSGTTFRQLESYLKDTNLGIPPDLTDYAGTVGGACSIGISFGSGGERYHIRQSVPSVEFVTPDGTLVRSGALTIKSVAGYDIARFMCGSRGMFGFITSVTFHLKPRREDSTLSHVALNCPSTLQAEWGNAEPREPILRALKDSLDPNGIMPGNVR